LNVTKWFSCGSQTEKLRASGKLTLCSSAAGEMHRWREILGHGINIDTEQQRVALVEQLLEMRRIEMRYRQECRIISKSRRIQRIRIGGDVAEPAKVRTHGRDCRRTGYLIGMREVNGVTESGDRLGGEIVLREIRTETEQNRVGTG
jgi:hypothetical protein